ncbi:MAG: hypothetical protein K0S41_3227 [Anaerocolumna sp.]|jgi:hypothetical protein|nr:hypothetical protein [Anaerocolumna sp.]
MRRILHIVGMLVISFILIFISNVYHVSKGKSTDDSIADIADAKTMTLLLNEIHDDYFIASNIGNPQYKYKITADLNDDFCVGDSVDVIYRDLIEIESNIFQVNYVNIKASDFTLDETICYKPVIYLYPNRPMDIDVKLDLNGTLTHTYPKYLNGWHVTAYPDGTLVDKSGIQYPYLFWEGKLGIDYDMSKGFCISGNKTKEFLNNILSSIGLNTTEKDEFIEFWVPFMEKNPYNKICFQTTAYTDNAKLNIKPTPDTILRVYMVFQPLNYSVEIEEQTFDHFNREGFTVVEWGGGIVK